MLAQLKVGMTREQVRFILGTSLLTDIFHADRWDYPYVKRNGRTVLSESRLTVFFDGDTLVKYEGELTQEREPSQDVPEKPASALESG